jgi:predicted CXXCH cytochrome family protein
MHNSQDGVEVVTGGPYEALTKGDCLGCHGQGTANNIITNIPQVLHSNTTDLAGGNFAYITGLKTRVTADQNTAGHNVRDLGATYQESVLTSPPGDENATGITNANLTCAGAYGCHGDRSKSGSFAGVSGAHHGDDSVLKFGTIDETAQGGTVATSYRFLLGVKGGEDDDWQNTATASDHNEYKGAVGTGTESTATSPGGGTISGLCAECHGNFHGPGTAGEDIGTASPWLRHPTDVVLPSSGEYANYNPDAAVAGEYSLEAPVARQTIPTLASSSTVTPGTDVVMCLSCHRAHASPYADILRWDYTQMIAGTGTSDTGCFICHTSKNAD